MLPTHAKALKLSLLILSTQFDPCLHAPVNMSDLLKFGQTW